MGKGTQAVSRGAFIFIGIMGGPILLFGGGSLLHAMFGG